MWRYKNDFKAIYKCEYIGKLKVLEVMMLIFMRIPNMECGKRTSDNHEDTSGSILRLIEMIGKMKLYGIRKKGTDEIEETFPSLEDSREKLPKGCFKRN